MKGTEVLVKGDDPLLLLCQNCVMEGHRQLASLIGER
jgi:hypothetical protein